MAASKGDSLYWLVDNLFDWDEKMIKKLLSTPGYKNPTWTAITATRIVILIQNGVVQLASVIEEYILCI